MDELFVIMQIGDQQMDAVYETAIAPAARDAGLAERRVDRHNAGDLLKSEIVSFIERATVIVADITNERPNCYLEIGYAMGLGKHANLILTAREDHHHGSERFSPRGPRVHFDLEGYDILFWKPSELDSFRAELATRIRRRAAIVSSRGRPLASADVGTDWADAMRENSSARLAETGFTGLMEITSEVALPQSVRQAHLLDAMRESQIHTFGWPIGAVFENRAEFRPRPTADGVTAEIALPGQSFDFWKVFDDGRFYTLLSLFEDSRAENAIFFDTRIVRVTEALLFLSRLYRRLGAGDLDRLSIRVRHAGLAGRTLRAASSQRFVGRDRHSFEDEVSTVVTPTMSSVESKLTRHVRELVDPLFAVFDFFTVSEPVVNEMVNAFAEGNVT